MASRRFASEYIEKKTRRMKPTKVVFSKGGLKRWIKAHKIEYPIIKLMGEPIESFERVSKIKEIILLGEDGDIRRIILT